MASPQSEDGAGFGSQQQRFIFLRKWNKLNPAHPEIQGKVPIVRLKKITDAAISEQINITA